jgi:hypothetical protein
MSGVMVEALDAFGAAMAEAEKHRTILRKNFGLNDQQIGLMTLARRRRKRSVMGDYGNAVLAAKMRLENRQ